jgi:hypothetical protein
VGGDNQNSVGSRWERQSAEETGVEQGQENGRNEHVAAIYNLARKKLVPKI